MLTSLTPSPEAALRAYVETWFQHLSLSNWSVALGMLDEPNSYGIRWGEQEIRGSIDEYSRSNAWSITDPSTMEDPGRTGFGEFNDRTGYWLDYDIPLNGCWSDLTAQFEFLKRINGYAVVLHDIHVL